MFKYIVTFFYDPDLIAMAESKMSPFKLFHLDIL